jgi:hypothetical protein
MREREARQGKVRQGEMVTNKSKGSNNKIAQADSKRNVQRKSRNLRNRGTYDLRVGGRVGRITRISTVQNDCKRRKK